MNMETPPDALPAVDPNLAQTLLGSSHEGLEAFSTGLMPLRKALLIAHKLGDENGRKMALRLQNKLDAMEPSITMIGQIKSGKTSLVNCLIGWPDLLPADVNPWTSVVTSLHLSPAPLTPDTSATFCFFEDTEWERLTAGGGRIGELADRAGADEELSKIKAQIEEVRAKSKARLGRKFEALLGQQHDYGYFDKELVARYVCLGDEFDDSTSASQGQFADITRSADLYFHQPAVPMGLCIRDTPGVNDTFMMREQITIRSIRDSRLCVVVLSAHQALSSTDLALVRLISNVKSRDVIIFVNRIDELSDPVNQVPQIHASIQSTLEKHKGPADAQIIAGSALWAQTAQSGPLSGLPEASKEALINWAESSDDPEITKKNAREILWELSGLPQLNAAIAERIVQGVGHEVTQQVASSARNLIQGIQLTDNQSAKAQVEKTSVHMAPDELDMRLQTLRRRNLEVLRNELGAAHADFCIRIDRVHKSFLLRATEALIQHLERYGEKSVWEYDPAGLRTLLGSSYKSFGRTTQKVYDGCVDRIIAETVALYHDALRLPEDLFDITPPSSPTVPPPVTLGQTIALDLKGSWWKSWWFRRRGYQAFADDFYEMIHKETSSFLDDLKTSQASVFHQDIIDQVDTFLMEQCEVLTSVVGSSSLGAEELDRLFDRPALQAREAELSEALKILEQYAT